METLEFDILICWKWFGPTTNQLCDFNATPACYGCKNAQTDGLLDTYDQMSLKPEFIVWCPVDDPVRKRRHVTTIIIFGMRTPNLDT